MSGMGDVAIDRMRSQVDSRNFIRIRAVVVDKLKDEYENCLEILFGSGSAITWQGVHLSRHQVKLLINKLKTYLELEY